MKKKPLDIPGNSRKSQAKKTLELPGDSMKTGKSHGTRDLPTPQTEPAARIAKQTGGNEPAPAKYRGHHPPGRGVRCGAKARTTGGKPCQRFALAGRNRCRLHGGTQPRGPLSANWKHGFYSAALPGDVAKLARQAAADPKLRDITEAIAVGDVRVRELLGTLKAGGIGTWDAAAKALKALQTAGGDVAQARKALADLETSVLSGRTQETAWKEVREIFQEKDRLLTGEVNRHKATADTINADRVAAFMVGMIDALREESHDRDLLRRVMSRWERLMGLAGVTAPAGGE